VIGMQQLSGFLGIVHKLMEKHKIIAISGESGTGKTTLALQLVGTFLTVSYPFEECCIWVQANEIFPIKRLSRMFIHIPEKSYLHQNIFLIPQNTTLNSYDDQSHLLSKLISGHTILPPNLRFMVIDNISYHLRYEISKYRDIKLITSLIDNFYDSLLMPLIMFCQREGIYLLLLHEITYDPIAEKNRPFLFKVYDRLNTIKIELKYRGKRKNGKRMNIFTQEHTQKFTYTLHDRGLVIE
jgi:ABC-type dipeptide/oligopeptide/nickel transport system ATPase component